MLIYKVLLATDFSLPSEQLVDCVSELKSFGLKEVVLVHVIDVRAPALASISFQGFNQEVLDKKEAKLESMGLKVKTMVPVGFPAHEIVKTALEEQVSMIAIASHGGGIIKELFLGSTTTDVIRTSPIPVLVEKYKDVDKATCCLVCQNKLKKVLLPLDFSIYSRKVLDQLKDVSDLIEEVILLSVVEGAYNDEALLKAIQEKEQKLEAEKEDLVKLGLKVKTIVCQGSASTNIVEVAEREDATLIVMATRGEGLIKELLLGSTAHSVARRSKRPLLLIPGPRA